MSADSAEPRVRHSLTEIDALIADATTADDDRVRGAGALLWEAAAYAFRALGGTTLDAALRQACQAQWSAAGLPAAELPSLLSALSAIMGVALSLHDRDHRAIGLAEQELADVLVRTEAEGARAWGMMLSLLVIRLPEASDALLTVAQRNRNNRPAAQAAVDSALAWVEAEADEPPCVLAPEAASALNRQAMLLETLAGKTPDPQHKRRLSAARTKLAASALQRYESCVQVELCESLSALPAEPEALAAQLEQVEMTARMLRAFELEARRLGNAPQFDKIIEQTSARVQQAPGLSLMDRARLMEIIAGTDAALRILNIK